jgi:hypothetical protein
MRAFPPIPNSWVVDSAGTDYRTEEFWKEVDEFHKQYLEHQDQVQIPVLRGD